MHNKSAKWWNEMVTGERIEVCICDTRMFLFSFFDSSVDDEKFRTNIYVFYPWNHQLSGIFN